MKYAKLNEVKKYCHRYTKNQEQKANLLWM